MSEDTFSGYADDPLSLNLYTYCQNDPIAYTDPTGHYIYIGADGKQHETDVIVDGNHPYTDTGTPNDGIFVYTDTHYINASNSAGVGVYGGSTVKKIEVSAGSTAKIYNYGTIGTISTGADSSTTINNNETGYISSITFGAKSTDEINNSGIILTVKNGGRTHTTIENTGYLGSVTRGTGFSTLSINGKSYNEYNMTANYNINEPWENSFSGKYGVSNYDAAMLRSIYRVGNDNDFAFGFYRMLPICVQSKIDIWEAKNIELKKKDPVLYYTKYADEVLNYYDVTKQYSDTFKGMDDAIKTKDPFVIFAAGILFCGGTNTNSKMKSTLDTQVKGSTTPLTNKQATDLAEYNGYKVVKNLRTRNGQPIYTNGKDFISPDLDSHNGGVWKKARTPDALNRKDTRDGTYDALLNRMGD